MIVTAEYMERNGYFGIWMKGHEDGYELRANQVEVSDPGDHLYDWEENLHLKGYFFSDRDQSFRDLSRLLEANPATSIYS